MSKTSSVYRNLKRVKMAEKYANRRQKQKAIAMDKSASPEERMQAQFALQKFPKNSARCRIRNRCKITGRSRSYYRKFGLGRVELRDLASFGKIPCLVKSSW